ncbi:TIGR03862 family flavoprotein [Yoonia sp. SS1-5]|uniref:TIGR03862 family flavoprotein n=1 Tax=Yoonia rhodophyticola TaxID=3137370 RepID=A0AAN0MAQ8_9RHOB
MTHALVIGAGPAGLMAAEVLADAGHAVTIADAMPSFGRKFLMAGKSGLNITKDEPADRFLAAYGDVPSALRDAVARFGPDDVIKWVEGLGQAHFTGSTGRVFPQTMKASPLLRSWLQRLGRMGAVQQRRWRWVGWDGTAIAFETPDGRMTVDPDVTILALGGASWAKLGANGDWSKLLPDDVVPFQPANFGLAVPWSSYVQPHFGSPIKSVMMQAATLRTRGECVLTSHGLEGGGIYMLGPALREGHPLIIDLKPDWSLEKLRVALAKPRGKNSLSNHLRKTVRLEPAQIALLAEFGRPYPDDLGGLIKGLPIPHDGPRPMDEAISTAGGVRFDALTGDLMLSARPGVFCAGEMLDWEAPTGGYLITACLATGRHAALGACRFLAGRD